MGCFCKRSVAALREETTAAAETTDAVAPDATQARPEDKVVDAVSTWLAARWLPAPPWQPDPEWQEVELPEPPMPQEALSVVSGLIQAQQTCQTELAVDPAQPGQLAKLARIISTLNRRTDDLQDIADSDAAPWDEVAGLNDRADMVRAALSQGVLTPQEADPPIGPWRPLLAKVKALAPLVSVFRTLNLDPGEADTAERLAQRVRQLRAVVLPPVVQPLTVFRLIARYSAIDRLQRSLGADPRKVPFERVQRAVRRKVDAVVQQLPETIRMADDRLDGMPRRQPNPSQLLTPAMIGQARALTPALLDRLRWTVPDYGQMDLLTTAAPVARLVALLRPLGIDPVRSSPCDGSCDARAVGSRLAATGLPGSGTGAAPAG